MRHPIKAIHTPKMISASIPYTHIRATGHHDKHMEEKRWSYKEKQVSMLSEIINACFHKTISK